MEVIDKKVLVKEVRPGQPDLVYSVRNLPKEMIYQSNGSLQPGIMYSQTGDGGLVFERYDREASDRLGALDRYIEALWPRTKTLPRRIPNQSSVGLSSSPALTKAQLEERMEAKYGVPFVDLPVPKEGDVPSFAQVDNNKEAVKTFAADDYFNPNAKTEPKKVIEHKEEVIISDTKCAVCDYEAPAPKYLKTHIKRSHSDLISKEAASPPGG